MSKYKLWHIDLNLSLIHLLINIKVPPLSKCESSVCNTGRGLCQLKENLYSCDVYIDM